MKPQEPLYELEDTQAMDLSSLHETSSSHELETTDSLIPKWLGQLSILNDKIDVKAEQFASNWNAKAEKHATMRFIGGVASVLAVPFGRGH